MAQYRRLPRSAGEEFIRLIVDIKHSSLYANKEAESEVWFNVLESVVEPWQPPNRSKCKEELGRCERYEAENQCPHSATGLGNDQHYHRGDDNGKDFDSAKCLEIQFLPQETVWHNLQALEQEQHRDRLCEDEQFRFVEEPRR